MYIKGAFATLDKHLMHWLDTHVTQSSTEAVLLNMYDEDTPHLYLSISEKNMQCGYFSLEYKSF